MSTLRAANSCTALRPSSGGLDPVRDGVPPGLGHGDAATGGEESRAVRDDLGANLKRQVASVLPEAHRGADAVVGALLQIVDEPLARAAEVHVGVDDCRNHRLARQIDAGRAGRDFHRIGSSDLRESGTINDERRVFDPAVRPCR